jgi:hypothetical protein
MPMSPRLLRPIASGKFDPRSIAGLRLWLDADDASTFTFNGSNVSQWRDKSGNNVHANQATAQNQPPYNATTLNGRGALLPAAASGPHFMDTGTLPTKAQPNTFIFVCRGFTAGNIFDAAAGARQFAVVSAGTYQIGSGTAQTGGTVSAGIDICVAKFDSPNSFFRRNGNQSGALNTGTNALTAVRLFTFSGAAGAATGTFGEMLAYGDLSLDQISAVEKYLARKYGVTLA